jgi:hypothetical protein
MVRARNLAAWCLFGAGAFAGCRIGYDELPVDEPSAGGDGGRDPSGGTSGSGNGSSGAVSGAGEAGADAAGGASVNGGTGGSLATGGDAGSMTAGEGGAAAVGGSSGVGGSVIGTDGGVSGASGGTTPGASGDSSQGGTSEAGAGGASAGGASAGGVSGDSGTGGVLGAGGFAGASSLGDCQTNTFGGHDYVFCNVNISWTAARDNCASIGMLLVRIDDASESQWVYDNVYDGPPRQGVWIGANDLAQEGEWRWTDGTLFWLGTSTGSVQDGLFAAWHSTQPSGQEPRDCAALDGNTLGWYDLDCTIPQPYACESP